MCVVTTARVRPLRTMGTASESDDAKDVVIGISPAFGLKLYQTTAGHALSEVLGAMMVGPRRAS